MTATAQSGGGVSSLEASLSEDQLTKASSLSVLALPASTARSAIVLTPTPLATQPRATTATITATVLPTTTMTVVVTGTPEAAASATATPDQAATPPSGSTPPVGTTGTVTVAAVPAASGTPAPALPALTPAVGGSGLATEALISLNQVRTNNGRPALKPNASLSAAAEQYARSMAERNFFGHDSPDGSSPQGRAIASGYAGQFRGEALAAGQTSAQAAIATWLNSPAHAAIVLEPSSLEVGIGYWPAPGSAYGHYWVLITGNPP